uniref:Uncharacterized protein n=1 Tax=Leersia perrieri TaxID=77586 RepID=A0A0D9XJQ6_9ORYZ
MWIPADPSKRVAAVEIFTSVESRDHEGSRRRIGSQRRLLDALCRGRRIDPPTASLDLVEAVSFDKGDRD